MLYWERVVIERLGSVRCVFFLSLDMRHIKVKVPRARVLDLSLHSCRFLLGCCTGDHQQQAWVNKMNLSTTFLLAPPFLTGINASPWIGTEYVAIVETTVVEGYTGKYITEDPLVETSTIPISPTATNPDVLTTFTAVDSYSTDVTAINLVVAPTAGVPITGYNYLDYYVNIVYTAPSSCSFTTSQTLSTAIPIFVPYEAEDIVHPETVITSTITYQYITDRYTRTMAMLDPTDIPSSVYASASSAYAPAMYTACSDYNYLSSNYGSGSGHNSGGGSTYSGWSECTDFAWYIGNSAFSGGYCCADGCHYTWGITPWGLALAIFFSWFGLFLIIGLVESWFIFRRAMLGQKVRRGLPYGFACLCPVLSCLFLFTVKKYPVKTTDQQTFLAAKWAETTTGAAMGLWLKNFFRRRDPAAVALGFPSGMPTAPYPPPPRNVVSSTWYPWWPRS